MVSSRAWATRVHTDEPPKKLQGSAQFEHCARHRHLERENPLIYFLAFFWGGVWGGRADPDPLPCRGRKTPGSGLTAKEELAQRGRFPESAPNSHRQPLGADSLSMVFSHPSFLETDRHVPSFFFFGFLERSGSLERMDMEVTPAMAFLSQGPILPTSSGSAQAWDCFWRTRRASRSGGRVTRHGRQTRPAIHFPS